MNKAQTDLFNLEKNAVFSECRIYRYALWRIWNVDLPKVMFIGLNPSTANEDTDDPTIRRVIRFAKDWGYGGVYMTNLFAIVSPYPEVLKTCEDPLGDNNDWLTTISGMCKDIIFAWGNFDVFGRDKEIIAMFPEAFCLGKNKNGTPKHPLYIAANTIPQLYKQ